MTKPKDNTPKQLEIKIDLSSFKLNPNPYDTMDDITRELVRKYDALIEFLEGKL